MTPLVVFVLAPIVPPGHGSVQASGQVVDNTMLFGLSTPVALVVLVFFGYTLVVFRERDPLGARGSRRPRPCRHADLWVASPR